MNFITVPVEPVYIKPSLRTEPVADRDGKKPPYESVMHYLSNIEHEYFNGTQVGNQSIETKLIQIHTLYMAAWAVGELTWDEAFYGYADFVAKLLHIR